MDALDEEAAVTEALWDDRVARSDVALDLAAEEDAAEVIVWMVVDVVRVLNGLQPTPEYE
jgi:hypothetical protein